MYPREAEEGEKRKVNTQPYEEQEIQRINVSFRWVLLSQKLQMFWSPHATPSTMDPANCQNVLPTHYFCFWF